MLKPLLIAFAWLCVGWGVLAAIIPLVPTTPFLFLGLYILSRNDPRVARRLKVRLGRGRRWFDRQRLRFSLG